MSALFEKARKLKFGISPSSVIVMPELVAVACACVAKQCLSRLQRVHVQAAA
jgi:hypothetical protein